MGNERKPEGARWKGFIHKDKAFSLTSSVSVKEFKLGVESNPKKDV